MLKKYILILFLLSAVMVSAGTLADLDFPKVKQSKTLKILTNATSTKALPEKVIYTLDGIFDGQSVCVKIKDADGAGFTYLTTQAGVGTFTKTSCE